MQEFLRDKYRILHEIGQGGMAVVYKGVDTALDREVAVKVLHPHLAGRADSRMRLQREAKAVAKLHHPNILEIYDYSGLDCDQSYIVTEYIRGETLKDFTDRHTPSLPEVGAMIVHEIASALAHAHDGGIIHRDIKPENIMIRDDGVLKLMDFGIAQIIDMQAMTVTGALVGSPAHMSPEHVEGKPLDFRADVFSAGTLLYFLCVGRLPFDSPSPHALLRQILEARYDDPRMHNPAVGKRLYGIITRCLERDPEDRYESVEMLREDIAEYLFDLGIEEPAPELAEYFEDPNAAEALLTRRVVDRLMDRAHRDSGSGRVASALEAYNHVLALQGDRADALSQVRRLSTSRSRHRTARIMAIATVALGIVAGGVWGLVNTDGPSAELPSVDQHAAVMPAQPAAAAVPIAVPVAAPAAVPSTIREIAEKTTADIAAATVAPATAEMAVVAPAPPPGLPRRGAAAATTRARATLAPFDSAMAARLRRFKRQAKKQLAKANEKPVVKPSGPNGAKTAGGVTFTIRNRQAAEIHFMGKVYPNGYTSKITLPEGTSQPVRIHKPGCVVCLDGKYTVRVSKQTPASIWYPLRFKPATLLVTAPPGSIIRAAGRTTTSGRPLAIKMGSKRKRTVLVRVSRAGHVEGKHAVELLAGSQTRATLGAGPPVK